ncbi:MAG: hypothetical protein N2322_01900, partial [Terrimicrobiaceae bacterium]|nr:hypothetical protein [Terrimicrobiaceae bacterium]
MKRTTLLAWLASSSLLLAGAAEDWKEILALDSGPRKKPATAAEGREAALRHLTLQRSSLEEFLEKYPRDPKA